MLIPYDKLYFIIEGEFAVWKKVTFIREENRARIDFKGNSITERMTLIINRIENSRRNEDWSGKRLFWP